VRSRQALRYAVPVVVLALGAAACGSSDDDKSDGGSPSSSASASNLKKGGTLKVLGEEDIANWDTAPAYDTNSYHVLRTLQRQLYTNAASNDDNKRLPNQPDVAAALPEISSDGLTYTIKIKQGVKWNSSPARQVTSQDAVRGFKFMCNPIKPFGAIGYYTDTIDGMKQFCDGFAAVTGQDAASLKAYTEANQVSGITAPDDQTLVIKLKSPAADFIHLLTLPTVSPRPVEAEQYVPDSPDYRQHIVNDGPYQVQSYVPDKSATLVRNPAWDASTDPVRAAYVDQIDLTFGIDQANIQTQLLAGTGDVPLGNTQPAAADLAQVPEGDPNLELHPTGGQNPYAVFNTVGGNEALKKKEVRQAINYAFNKRNLVQSAGGTRVAKPTGQIFGKSVVGEGWVEHDKYKTDGFAGDPTKAKKMLAEAGYPNGLTLTLVYRASGNGPKYAETIQQDLKASGITINLLSQPNKDFYTNFLQKTDITAQGKWDIALPGWSPDWEGASERSFFTPLLDGRVYGEGTTNYGKYDSDAVNTAADKALATTDQASSAKQWNDIDDMIMDDAPWVPIFLQTQASYHSAKVTNFQYYFSGSNGDLTQFALK
jgi:peptide/nickel transport system substrate-binding protein